MKNDEIYKSHNETTKFRKGTDTMNYKITLTPLEPFYLVEIILLENF